LLIAKGKIGKINLGVYANCILFDFSALENADVQGDISVSVI